MKLKLLAGTTSLIQHIFIQDSSSTTGAGLTGLVYNSAGLTCYYMRAGASASTAVTLATATLGTYSSGGFKEVDATNMPGIYELHIPNAAIASGAKRVVIYLKGATNMVQTPIEIELDAVDYSDATRFGLSALPNAAAAASGGLLVYGTGTGAINPSSGNVPPTTTFPTNFSSLSIDSSGRVQLIPAQVMSTQSGTAQAGAASTITLASGASSTDNLYVGQLVIITSGTGAGQTRRISSYVGSTKVATVSRSWVTNPDSTSVYSVIGIEAPITDSNLRTQIQPGTSTGQINLNSGNVPIDLTQSVPTSNTAQTVGDALNAARADGFGKWTTSGTTLTLYAADGTTVVRTFTLDSASAPTSRT